MGLGTSIVVYAAGGANRVVELRGKPGRGSNPAITGSYIVGDKSRPATEQVTIPLVDVKGNERLIADLRTQLNNGYIVVTDATGNQLTAAQLLGLLDGQAMLPFIGPYFWAGAPVVNEYILGSAANGLVVQDPITLKYLTANAKVANTVGSLVVTLKNITTNTSVTATIAQQGAGQAFVTVTLSAQLVLRKGDKLSLQWTTVGGTPGSDWQLIPRSIEAE